MTGPVQITFDVGRRDLLTVRMLQQELANRGVPAFISSPRTNTLVFRRHRPWAFVAPRGDYDWVKKIAKCSRVYVMPSEGARLTNETVTAMFTGRSAGTARVGVDGFTEHTFDYIRRAYLWGQRTHDVLLDTGLFRPDQLLVTGHPRFDVYSQACRPPRPDRPFTIGAAFSVRSTSFYYGKPYYARELMDFDDRGLDRINLLRPGGHFEDLAWRDFAVLRQIMRVLKRVIDETDWNIVLRVGMLEDPEDYRFIEERAPGRVRMQKPSGQLYDFFNDVDALLTCSSTVGMEALANDVPVIETIMMVGREKLDFHLNPQTNGYELLPHLYHSPTTLDEAWAMLESAKAGTLPLTPDPEYAESFLRDTYNWPNARRAAAAIADDLIADLADFEPPAPECYRAALPFANARVERFVNHIPLPERLRFETVGALGKAKFLVDDLRTGSFEAHREKFRTRNADVERIVAEVYGRVASGSSGA